MENGEQDSFVLSVCKVQKGAGPSPLQLWGGERAAMPETKERNPDSYT